MNRIDKVNIYEFWGNRTVTIDFFPDVNFFIGVNGSGKTTVINSTFGVVSKVVETEIYLE